MVDPKSWLAIALWSLLGCSLAAAEADRLETLRFSPDPASVTRSGPGYRYPQSGWIVVHIEGKPYERGFQHGTLLAAEIAEYIHALATHRSPKAPVEAWRDMRLLANSLFLRRYDQEYLNEMKGIADGAAAAGAKFDDRSLDLVDIVALNSEVEIEFLSDGLDAAPTGLEGIKFRQPPAAQTKTPAQDHCSAFAATGPATRDGKIVFGHITMFNLYHVRHFNVWLDIKPQAGHRIVMQTYPGGIMSGLDYYLNDAGMMVAETTLDQTRFDVTGMALASRIRRAVQYADSIDRVVDILRDKNNGLYTNEWLLADTKTNEIAMFELGTHRDKLWRSGKKEWPGGTEGFYWSCNNTKDLAVREETVPSLRDKPANLVFHPAARDLVWQQLFEKHDGQIDAAFGFEAFTTPPLAAFYSCDAKFTTTELAKDLKSWALFGPPLGKTWDPTPEERKRYPDIKSLVSNDWALLEVSPPPQPDKEALAAVDLEPFPEKKEPEKEEKESAETYPPVWRGTLLPKSDADLWLAAGFADYESIVALEKGLHHEAKEGHLAQEARDHLALALFAPRSHWLAAARRLGHDLPLDKIHPSWARNEWYSIAAGKGVMLLAALRRAMGADPFDKFMDDFGVAHGGRETTTQEFVEAARKAAGRSLDKFFEPWLKGTAPANATAGSFWAIESFEVEPQHALIVYGTLGDRHSQREAADVLQRAIARRWTNYTVPIKADTDVSDVDMRTHHLLLVGRPATNSLAAQCGANLPAKFASGSFTLDGETYAHADTALIGAAANPFNERYSLVLFAGLSARATWHAVHSMPARDEEAVQYVVLAAHKPARNFCLLPKELQPEESPAKSEKPAARQEK
jgi:hypothetical protein